ncbi:hypothetical protein [Streptomyces sp. AA1529]|uniref:hypothetical protein n=1 Tax=Streptomyces sp. AA1529 TaxID=1203257 RepID=UPI000300965C|nr:hypothetical protein [Streptomyces sp. AA1529]
MPDQLSRADLASLSPEEIMGARRSGRLGVLMGRNPTANEVLDTIERDQAQAQEAAAQADDSAPEPPGQPADSAPLPDVQLTREELKSMSSTEIVQAKAVGRLDGLLGRLH